MSSFSTIACYAALSSCSREDILHAYARMIAALIQRNRYKTCDTDTLCKDFKAYYGFSVPYHPMQTSVYKGYKQDKIEMRGDRAEMSDFPLYLNTVAGGLDCRDQTIGGFSFVVKIYAVPVVEIIG